MAEPSRYKVGGDEAASLVLKNKLEISDIKTLEDTETILLQDTYTHFFELLESGRLEFDADLVLNINKYFLSPLLLGLESLALLRYLKME